MTDPLYEYIKSHSSRQSDALAWVERQTHLRSIYSRMLCGEVEGELLHILVKMLKPKRALELGVFTGYSSICIASALLQEGHLLALEINDEFEDLIREGYAKAGVSDKITLVFGDAAQSLQTLGGEYDFVFIDANKREYCKYYDLLIDKVCSGGVIIADNVLWDGKVLTDSSDAQTLGIENFNSLVASDPRVENVIVPLRDGINLIRKR